MDDALSGRTPAEAVAFDGSVSEWCYLVSARRCGVPCVCDPPLRSLVIAAQVHSHAAFSAVLTAVMLAHLALAAVEPASFRDHRGSALGAVVVVSRLAWCLHVPTH